MVKETGVKNSPSIKTDQALIENFVSLQRVLTNLAVKIDDLSNKISKLLEIFEISAKSLAEKDIDFEKNNKDLNNKLDTLLEQNKTLARGISMISERSNLR